MRSSTRTSQRRQPCTGMFKDIAGILQEHESILVSGAPHYMEGKMLSATKSVDEDGDPTSTAWRGTG